MNFHAFRFAASRRLFLTDCNHKHRCPFKSSPARFSRKEVRRQPPSPEARVPCLPCCRAASVRRKKARGRGVILSTARPRRGRIDSLSFPTPQKSLVWSRGRDCAKKTDSRATPWNHFASGMTAGTCVLPGGEADCALAAGRRVSGKQVRPTIRHPHFVGGETPNRRGNAVRGSLHLLFQPTFAATTRDSNRDDTTKKVFCHVIRNFSSAQNRAGLVKGSEKRGWFAKICIRNGPVCVLSGDFPHECRLAESAFFRQKDSKTRTSATQGDSHATPARGIPAPARAARVNLLRNGFSACVPCQK